MFTKRELEVMQLRKLGKTQKEIAKALGVSQPAISNFENSVKRKIAIAKAALQHLKELDLL